MAKILCVPLDPVHDVGIKIISSELAKHGHQTLLLQPDLPMETIVKKAAEGCYDFIMVSRTLGYGVAELLARFTDLLDAAGIRERTKVVIGGKPVTAELAAELGYDMGFGAQSTIDEVLAYVEGREMPKESMSVTRVKKDLTAEYSYNFFDKEIESLLNSICDKLLAWAEHKSSPGIERMKLRDAMLRETDPEEVAELRERYYALCDRAIVEANEDKLYPKGVRVVSREELDELSKFLSHAAPHHPLRMQHTGAQPAVFKFLGSGCPIMDITHGKICERWGIDGFLIINPSWEARYEGLIEGCLTHENDGTITSFENIQLMRRSLDETTLLTVRAHRGLNTPETVLLAGEAGANLSKIDLVYGSLGAGTDPERIAVDGIEAMKLCGRYGMPFDIPGNDELSGVPAWKTLAGLLINVMLGKKLGAHAILKPLFCYGPHIVLNGQMKQNFVDYNTAKIYALRHIVDCPIWPGEPIAFMTQSEERIQSANTTSYHAALAATLGVDAITIASTDEAYSRGAICITSRIDTIRAVTDAFRFMGDAQIAPSPKAGEYTDELLSKIRDVLREVEAKPTLHDAIYAGLLGSEEDGAYPGKFGKGTVTQV
jgi:methylmalonyl-CoA mutase cobalamin-binding subunit